MQFVEKKPNPSIIFSTRDVRSLSKLGESTRDASTTDSPYLLSNLWETCLSTYIITFRRWNNPDLYAVAALEEPECTSVQEPDSGTGSHCSQGLAHGGGGSRGYCSSPARDQLPNKTCPMDCTSSRDCQTKLRCGGLQKWNNIIWFCS
ncbi:hypothetical protein ACS0TY_007568 [Phlomoides rotata]